MKLLHISDLHIGKTIYEQSLIEDQRYILNTIIEIIKENNIDGLLVSGDVYDRGVPSTEAVDLLNDFLNELVLNLKKKVFIISGNHDSKERLGFSNKILENQGLYIQTTYEGYIKNITFEKEKIRVYLLPFVKPAEIQKYFDEEIKTYDDAIKRIIEKEELDKEYKNIILTHQFIIPSNGEIERSESETSYLGGIENVKAEYFKDFDYAGLGHIHKPQVVINDKVRYSGSILKYSFSESHDTKIGVILDINEKINISTVPLTPKRDMREIKGKLNTLISDEVSSLENKEDYLKVILTDEEPLFNVIDILRKTYPNVLCVEFFKDKGNQNELNYANIDELKKLDVKQLFSDFYKEQNNVYMSEKCEKVIEEIINNVKEEN